MGYHTELDAHLDISPPLDPAQIAWVRAFAQSRRVCRHEERIASKPDPLREAVGLVVGVDGAFYTGDLQSESDETVANWNYPADPVPSLYSAWTVSEDGARLTGCDQASYPSVWLEVFVEILVGWGRSLSGHVWLQGEEPSDVSRVEVDGDTVIVREIVDDPEIARLALERDLPPESVQIAQRTLARAAAPKEGGRIVLPEDPAELDQSIEDLNLSVRTINYLLMNRGIETVRQLAGHSLETLVTNPEDRKVERELREILQELGWLA